MRVASGLKFLILSLSFLVLATPVQAHPHIFARYEVEIAEKDKANVHLHFTFTIHNVVVPHPLFHDQQIDNLFEALHEHPLLLFLDLNGRAVGQQEVEITHAGGTDSEPVYTYDMDIPADMSFGFSIYDPEYYDSVSLVGADAVKLKVGNLACSASLENVGNTMWGVNHASHVACGDKSKLIPQIKSFKTNRFEHPDSDAAPTSKQMLLP
jgi:ABC-type uncharacterized transport system substrate-binding protein